MSEHQRNLRKSKKEERKTHTHTHTHTHLTKPSKRREVFADIMWSRGILGMEGGLFVPHFL